jgi:hypothetical protein
MEPRFTPGTEKQLSAHQARAVFMLSIAALLDLASVGIVVTSVVNTACFQFFVRTRIGQMDTTG